MVGRCTVALSTTRLEKQKEKFHLQLLQASFIVTQQLVADNVTNFFRWSIPVFREKRIPKTGNGNWKYNSTVLYANGIPVYRIRFGIRENKITGNTYDFY